MKLDDQLAGIADAVKLGGNQAPPELNLENPGNMSTPTHANGLAESDTNPNSKNFQFSQSLGKCVAYLKSINCRNMFVYNLYDKGVLKPHILLVSIRHSQREIHSTSIGNLQE